MINYLFSLLSLANVLAAPCIKIPKKYKLFIYGTLKKGEPNHHWLTNRKNGVATFIALGRTVQRYPLVIATRYHMPLLLSSPGKGCLVAGEVYEVDDMMLGRLDFFKDHPKFYERKQDDIFIRNEKTGEFEKHRCWIYYMTEVTPELLSQTCYSTYSSKGPHGLPYIKRGEHQKVTKEDLKDIIIVK